MPAYFNEGFFVREPAWHGMGTVLEEYPGREEAMELAGHNFLVLERPIWVEDADDPMQPRPIPSWKALVKDTDETVLNVVRKSYHVVQNNVLWDVVDEIVSQPNVKYETAGVLKDGAVLWVLAWLDEPGTVPGDDSEIYPMVCCSTTHDGTGALQADATNIRVVCMNTFKMSEAQAKKSGHRFVFRHTKNVMERIEDAKMALRGVRAGHEEFLELSRDLAKIKVTKARREMFITSMIPLPTEALVSDRVVTNVETARQAIRSLFDGPTIPDAHKLTGYGLHLAGVEYLDHLRAFRNQDTYFNRAVLTAEPAKVKLASLIREVAKA